MHSTLIIVADQFQTEQFITETLLHRLENQKACANKRLTLTLLIAMITLILCPIMTVAYLLHTQGLQRANRIFGQELHLSMEQISSQKQISELLLTNYMPKNLVRDLLISLLPFSITLLFRCYRACLNRAHFS